MENELERLKKEVTTLKEREAELEASLEEWKDFAENASLPLHWVNGSGIVIWVNQSELDLLGFKKSEFLNQHISKFHADSHVIEDILKRLMNKETLTDYPARLRCKNGAIRHVLINSNVYWKNGQFIHTRCFTRDITKFRSLDEEKDKLISELKLKLDEQTSRLAAT